MRILIVASEFPPGPGGIGTHAYELARQLHAFGHEVLALANQDYAVDDAIARFTAAQPFELERVPRVPTPIGKLAYRSVALGRALARWRPDVMLATGDREIYAASLAGALVPWVCVEHGRRPTTTWERAVKRWAFGRANAVVSVSKYSERRLLEAGVHPRRSVVITNGADPARFAPGTDAERTAALAEIGVSSAHLIVSVGHVSERKGQDVLIRALPRVAAAVPDVHYAIVGKPTRAPQFGALAAQLGVADRVHFLGQVDDTRLRRLVAGCDLHAMTSRHTADQFEGYGIAVVEAAFCARPSVVTGNSGLAEAVVDGETGLVARPDDPDDVARAVIALLRDDGHRRAMGEAARRRALAEQTWEHCARQFEALLGSVGSDGRIDRR